MAWILVADDVALSREALARSLRERGHDVIAVADGQEAIDRFQRELPDAVIMDVTMPRMSGIDAAARIKAVPGRHTPVLLLSARLDLDTRLAALAVADDFVGKPYDAAELAARLEAHLRTRRLVDEMLRGRTSAGDQPSGMKTKAALLERLNEEWMRAVRFNEPLSLLLLGPDQVDLDTATSTALSESILRVLRQIDVVARYQGVDICAVLPNTHVAGALVAATRLKKELAKTLVAGAPLRVSMGISFYPGKDISEQADLIRMAERAIARARSEGSGSICLFQHQGYLFHPE